MATPSFRLLFLMGTNSLPRSLTFLGLPVLTTNAGNWGWGLVHFVWLFLFYRVCQQEKEEDLIDLGCQCRGGLAKSHRTCIDTWFHTKGSNKCEICQQVASNVSPPESQPSVGIQYLCVNKT
ncbi:hypothetical protein CK203_024144 [Vitis vinifera]|uniref:RING-CH-type domain-containing protein n=1 Tax=Vitis vinifera TaxID=29760 RepID=A0A438I4X7_VITVI|nr:hypothetical protein CK203_024144 [Vitis vinifera]